MLESKVLLGAIVTIFILTLLPDKEANAAPVPCKELVDFVFNTDRFRKSRHKTESEELDEREKRRKEKIKQLNKIDQVLEKLVRLESSTEAPEVKPTTEPKGGMDGFMSSYINFLTYLMNI